MNSKVSFIIFYLTIIFVLFIRGVPVQAQQIKIVTEDFAPFQYKENNQVVGMATEVVRAVISGTSIKGDITIYPWARAYEIAKKEKNVLIFSIARTKERESIFKWVGTVAPYRIYFFKLKSREDIVVNKLEDAKIYFIGGEYRDVKQQYLTSKGFNNIQLVPKSHLNILKLYAGRVDLIPFDELGFAYKAQKLGFNTSKIEKVFFLNEISSDLYMAFSKNSSDTIVQMFKKSLEKIKTDGRYQKILEKYVKR